MKRTGRLFLLIAFLPGLAGSVQAQGTVEEDYRKEKEAIWREHDRTVAGIAAYCEKRPERKDSLVMAITRTGDAAAGKTGETALRYASVPEALGDLFRARNFISKDTLGATLKRLSAETQGPFYGKCLRAHLETEQVEEGGACYDFRITGQHGEEFAFSSLTGRNILLVCGGLGCMQEEGRAYLDKIYAETSRDDLRVAVYCFCNNPDELRRIQASFGCKYPLVSDFRGDDGPVKIRYGVQELPTCFLIDRQGTVILKPRKK